MRIVMRLSAGAAMLAVWLAVSLAMPVTAEAQSDTRSLYVRNSGSVPLSTIHVSPDYSSQWGSDRLGTQTIQPGEQVQLRLDDHAEDCFFDVQVRDANGESREFWGLNVCSEDYLDVQ